MSADSSSSDLTRLLAKARDGDQNAEERLWQIVYPNMKVIAHRQLRHRRPGQTLQTTALVHEAYLKLFDHAQARWNDRLHFYAAAAKAMRHILVDHARRKVSKKHGGHLHRLDFDEAAVVADERAETFLVLDSALSRLTGLDERMGAVVECRFFGGMSDGEIADWLGIAKRTVQRDWQKARVWLAAALTEPTDHAGEP